MDKRYGEAVPIAVPLSEVLEQIRKRHDELKIFARMERMGENNDKEREECE